MFMLWRSGQSVAAEGLSRFLERGPVTSLERRVRTFFQEPGNDEAPRVIVGALPFDVAGHDFLFQPKTFNRSEAAASPFGDASAPRYRAPRRMVSDPTPAAYAAVVREALSRIKQGDVAKVVLARSLCIDVYEPVDARALAGRLARDPNAITYLVDLSLASGARDHTLVGATPELLVSRTERRVTSHPLAGSARRSPNAAEDQRAGQALLQSEKDMREHKVVVESILDILAPLCSRLAAPGGTTLCSTATMWHLGTRIEGELKADAPSAAGLAALLHPTPAVGGVPREAANRLIHELETHDRGFYAGAVGWTDAQGDGEWYVTLRCAEIQGTRLVLHAGAGIVAGSDPDAEAAETSAKFRTMLRALGMEEQEELMKAI